MDISKPLPRCLKLRLDGKQIGLVGLKYERLPNFYYWCGHVTNGERDCEVWLRGRGKLRRDDQQYDEWLRVELTRKKAEKQWLLSQAMLTINHRGGRRANRAKVKRAQFHVEMVKTMMHSLQWRLNTTWTTLWLLRKVIREWSVNMLKGNTVHFLVGQV